MAVLDVVETILVEAVVVGAAMEALVEANSGLGPPKKFVIA